MKLTSPAFCDKNPVPARYTCKEPVCSPPLEFLDVPETAKSLLVLVEDLDEARQFVHWLVYNIPPRTTHIPEGKMCPEAKQGLSGNAQVGYVPPCPDEFSGIHRFSFTLYALDTLLDLPDDADRAIVLQAMDGHIIRQATLVGVAAGNQVASALSYH